MYIDRCKTKKKYYRVLLRDSYRIDGKNRHHTILNLTHWPKKDLDALELALKHKDDLGKLVSGGSGMRLEQGLSVGAVHLVVEIARRLGIEDALGKDRNGRLALWQVVARVIDQGSRLSAVRLATSHAGQEFIGLEKFNEDDLYKNLGWLAERQPQIEARLFKRRCAVARPKLFLYDATSSYFEGECNELAAFGYNRDKKRGKRQIVVGLLCDEVGSPVSIEIFPGNTPDSRTVGGQIRKLSEKFGGAEITLVGDRGMIKSPQMSELNAEGFHYITAITKPQIEKLLDDGILQMELFDEDVAEVTDESGERYVCRRNPHRAEEIRQSRESRFFDVCAAMAKANAYLSEHPRASAKKALEKIKSKVRNLRIDGWLEPSLEPVCHSLPAPACACPHADRRVAQIGTGRSERIKLTKNEAKLSEASKLDGCYALKTDLKVEQADKHLVHSRYKDLALVERAFRTSKTVELEMRPIFLRREDNTRGHALVVMLAYSVVKKLAECWAPLDMTVQEGIDRLTSLCATNAHINGGSAFSMAPEPRKDVRRLYDLAGVKPPTVVPKTIEARADTKAKLNKRRK